MSPMNAKDQLDVIGLRLRAAQWELAGQRVELMCEEVRPPASTTDRVRLMTLLDVKIELFRQRDELLAAATRIETANADVAGRTH